MRKNIVLLIILIMMLCWTACDDRSSPNEDEHSYETLSSSSDPMESTKADPTQPTEAEQNTVKNVDQILEDIKNKDLYAPETVFEELSIIKRQTREEDLTDVVYVKLSAHTDALYMVSSYILTYNLYNEGWILDSAEMYLDGENYSIARSGPDDELILSLFESYNNVKDLRLYETHRHYHSPYSSYKIVDRTFDMDSQAASFVVEAQITEVGWTITETIQIDYEFLGSWYEKSSIADSVIASHIDYSPLIGDYYTEETSWEKNEYWLSITDIDENNNEITIEYTRVDGSGDTYQWSGTSSMQAFSIPGLYGGCYHLGSSCELDSGWRLQIKPKEILLHNKASNTYISFDLSV